MKLKLTNCALLFAALLLNSKQTVGQTAPENMALIPAGTFMMGDSFGDGWGTEDERPTHTVFVSAFYMDKYEVTKAFWDEVYRWATANGYSFENPGSGKAASHPVQTVSWYDVAKWCNARSEREGWTPTYYTDAALVTVYKIGRTAPYVKWNAGYRLPTEAEWEKAARGGFSEQRFPWGNTITHSQANYKSDSSYSYDLSPTLGYHPTYNDGMQPYTSPVGSFAANGYGLYNMADNVWEWCGDWYDSSYYRSSPGTDPRGPASGPYRVIRGGSWYYDCWRCRSAFRVGNAPGNRYHFIGFRAVLSWNFANWANEVFGKLPAPTQPTYSAFPKKEDGKDSLVVVTHGWNPDVKWLDEMTNNIQQYLTSHGLNNWQVHAHKWVEKATTVLPETALHNGEQEGTTLGEHLAVSKWNHIHFIAHSAGTGLIQTATGLVKENDVTVTIHETFLDPYVGRLRGQEHIRCGSRLGRQLLQQRCRHR